MFDCDTEYLILTLPSVGYMRRVLSSTLCQDGSSRLHVEVVFVTSQPGAAASCHFGSEAATL
jgi:hypothetical protein